MDVAFAEYEAITMLEKGETLRTLPVDVSDGMEVSVLLTADLTGVIPKNVFPDIEIDLPQSLEAPVQAGQIVGEVRMLQGETVLCAVPLAAGNDVLRDDFASRWETYIENWLLLAR